jgi:hypothetical protein
MNYLDDASLEILQRRFRNNPQALERHLTQWDKHLNQPTPAPEIKASTHIPVDKPRQRVEPEPFDFAAFERDIKRKSLALIAAVIAVLWVIHSLLN